MRKTGFVAKDRVPLNGTGGYQNTMELKQLKENEINPAENAKSKKKKVFSVYNYGSSSFIFLKLPNFPLLFIIFVSDGKNIPLNKNDNIPELNKSTPYRQDQGQVQTSFFMVSVCATSSITATHRKMNSDQEENTVLPSTIAPLFRVLKTKKEQFLADILHSSPTSPSIKKEANKKTSLQTAISTQRPETLGFEKYLTC